MVVSTRQQQGQNGSARLSDRLRSFEKPKLSAHCGSTVVTAETSACSTFADSSSELQLETPSSPIEIEKITEPCHDTPTSACASFAEDSEDTIAELRPHSPTRKKKKKKRLMMVRAGDLASMPRRTFSDGCGDVDPERLKEAVKNWQAESGNDELGETNVKIKISTSRRNLTQNYRSRSLTRLRNKSHEPENRGNHYEEKQEEKDIASAQGEMSEPTPPRRRSRSRSRSRHRRSNSRGPAPLEKKDVKQIESVLNKLVSGKLTESTLDDDSDERGRHRSRSKSQRHRSRSCGRSKKKEHETSHDGARKSQVCHRSRSCHRRKIKEEIDAEKVPARTLCREKGSHSLAGHLKSSNKHDSEMDHCETTVVSHDLSIENAFGLNVAPPPPRSMVRSRSLNQGDLSSIPRRRIPSRCKSDDDLGLERDLVRSGVLTKDDIERLSAAGYRISKD